MKKILALVLAVVFVMIIPISVCASDNGMSFDEEYFEVEPIDGECLICNDRDDGKVNNTREVIVSSAYFKSLSTTRALATVQAKTSEEEITSVIQLQRYNSNTNKYVNVSGATAKKTVNSYIIKHSPEFSVSASYKYRIKATLNDGDEIIIKFAYLE
ncbi:MAG: hypothetical protein UEP31_05620 [Anaerovoracaceae bacterium]|nr:hypothetical protein [Anaerovoracaceae bacterium]